MAPLGISTNLNVLIIEDNDDDADLVLAELERSGFVARTRRVQTEPEFRDALKDTPDAILSDYTVPGFGARRALAVCAELGVDAPFIVVTGSISEEVAVDCMKRGAADYLLKDRLARLGSALEQAVAAHAVRREKRRAESSRDAAMRELDHRVRNNLAVVLGLAEFSVRSCDNLEAFAPAFMGRVRALAAVHDALAEEQWLRVDLRSLVLRIIPLMGGGGDLRLEGVDLRVPAHFVQPIGLALYELTRHAISLGFWRVPGDCLTVSWAGSVETGLNITWDVEPGAPAALPAASAAAHTDPSLSLVEGLIRSEARGTFSLSITPARMYAAINLPMHTFAGTIDPVA